MKLKALLVIFLIKIVSAQDYQDYEAPAHRSAPVRLRPGNGPVAEKQAPIAILKQINRHNEDGSYTYGYEGADGSFKIETKLATGEVKGKYGYVDADGKVRVVEYGANKYGFQPSGEGITVPPPTTIDETTDRNGNRIEDYEEELHQQQIPVKSYVPRVTRPRPSPRPRPQYVEYEDEAPAPRQLSQPQYAPQPQYTEPEPRQPPQQYSPAPAPPRLQIPGAQPTDVLYSPQSRPSRPDSEYTQIQSFGASLNAAPQPQNVRVSRPIFQPSAIPSSHGQQFNSSPVRPVVEQSRPEPQHYQEPAPQPQAQRFSAPQGRSTSVLDQLAKDYALPQNGANPLHDITFGYY